jgi:hypothetical protein
LTSTLFTQNVTFRIGESGGCSSVVEKRAHIRSPHSWFPDCVWAEAYATRAPTTATISTSLRMRSSFTSLPECRSPWATTRSLKFLHGLRQVQTTCDPVVDIRFAAGVPRDIGYPGRRCMI